MRKCTGQLHREHMMNIIRRANGRSNGQGMRVNAKWCYSTKDRRIQDLIKRGLIKQIRVDRASARCRYSAVVPVDGSTLPSWAPLLCPECGTNCGIKPHAWNCSFVVSHPSQFRKTPKNRRYV